MRNYNVDLPITFDVLVVVEGTDGSGKATQSAIIRQKLCENRLANSPEGCHMSDHEVVELDFPDYNSTTGEVVRAMLNGKYGEDAAKLNPYFTSPMYAIDRYAYLQKLNQKYRNPITIGVSNRYTISNLIHQGSRLRGAALAEYWAWEEDFEYNRLGLPRPTITIYLDMPYEVALQNVIKRAEETKVTLDINERSGFMQMVYNHTARLMDSIDCWRIDAGEIPPRDPLYDYSKQWVVVNCYDEASGQLKSIDDINKTIMDQVYNALIKRAESADDSSLIMYCPKAYWPAWMFDQEEG